MARRPAGSRSRAGGTGVVPGGGTLTRELLQSTREKLRETADKKTEEARLAAANAAAAGALGSEDEGDDGDEPGGATAAEVFAVAPEEAARDRKLVGELAAIKGEGRVLVAKFVDGQKKWLPDLDRASVDEAAQLIPRTYGDGSYHMIVRNAKGEADFHVRAEWTGFGEGTHFKKLREEEDRRLGIVAPVAAAAAPAQDNTMLVMLQNKVDELQADLRKSEKAHFSESLALIREVMKQQPAPAAPVAAPAAAVNPMQSFRDILELVKMVNGQLGSGAQIAPSTPLGLTAALAQLKELQAVKGTLAELVGNPDGSPIEPAEKDLFDKIIRVIEVAAPLVQARLAAQAPAPTRPAPQVQPRRVVSPPATAPVSAGPAASRPAGAAPTGDAAASVASQPSSASAAPGATASAHPAAPSDQPVNHGSAPAAANGAGHLNGHAKGNMSPMAQQAAWEIAATKLHPDYAMHRDFLLGMARENTEPAEAAARLLDHLEEHLTVKKYAAMYEELIARCQNPQECVVSLAAYEEEILSFAQWVMDVCAEILALDKEDEEDGDDDGAVGEEPVEVAPVEAAAPAPVEPVAALEDQSGTVPVDPGAVADAAAPAAPEAAAPADAPEPATAGASGGVHG